MSDHTAAIKKMTRMLSEASDGMPNQWLSPSAKPKSEITSTTMPPM
jgi:hypothetical protein